MICISALEGMRLLSIGRAGDMLWIKFERIVMEQKMKGEDTKKSKYILDIQCPWRMEDKKNFMIILASHDMYEPNSQTEWTEDFEWDVQGNNLFDEKIKKIFSVTDIKVEQIFVSPNNDLTVWFSNGLALKTFIDVSSEIECWRFFEKGKDEHLVIYGDKTKVE